MTCFFFCRYRMDHVIDNGRVVEIRYKCTKCSNLKFRRELYAFLTPEELAEIAFLNVNTSQS